MKTKHSFWILLLMGVTLFGFGAPKKDWKEGVATIGIRVQINAPDLKVYYARSKKMGLNRFNKKAIEKDQNTSDRMELALRDFSIPKVAYNEFKNALEQVGDFKVIQEADFEQTPPDFIFDVDVLDYSLVQKGLDPLPRAFFYWKVYGRTPGGEKAMWVFSRDKLSPGKTLKRWLSNKAEVLKGEFRAHILFSVQDLLYEIGLKKRKFGLSTS